MKLFVSWLMEQKKTHYIKFWVLAKAIAMVILFGWLPNNSWQTTWREVPFARGICQRVYGSSGMHYHSVWIFNYSESQGVYFFFFNFCVFFHLDWLLSLKMIVMTPVQHDLIGCIIQDKRYTWAQQHHSPNLHSYSLCLEPILSAAETNTRMKKSHYTLGWADH